MSEQLKPQIKKIIVNALKLEVLPEEIGDSEMLFGESMDIDSIATLEIVTAIEGAFTIRVEDDELTAELFDSVCTLADYVAKKISIHSQAN